MPDHRNHDRLPKGQYLTRDFPVVHAGQVPHLDPTQWSLRVHGLVESPATLSHADFLALPRVQHTSDMHCVATWSRYDLEWEGVPVRRILHAARPLPEATHALIHADGGYTTNLPLETLFREDVLLADGLGGEPLPVEHGWPARLVVPGLYAYKSAKWVRSIEILPEDRHGFWESRGYSNSADAFREERFAPVDEPKPPVGS